MEKSIFGRLLLASGSPRRRQLLTEAGFDVEVLHSRDVAETHPVGMATELIPEYLSVLKAMAYEDIARNKMLPLVAGDTIVSLDGEVIGKPVDADDAGRILGRLSGRWHEVVSGVSLIVPGREKPLSFSETTRVKFAQLPQWCIDRYIGDFKPFDKAGAYGIQEWIGLVGVERIEGDFYNIMGFPVRKFMEIYLEVFPYMENRL